MFKLTTDDDKNKIKECETVCNIFICWLGAVNIKMNNKQRIIYKKKTNYQVI